MWFFKFFLILLNLSFAEVNRISSVTKDLGKVEKIYLNEGLISVLDFPEEVSDVKVGNAKDFKIILSEKFPKEITVFLSRGNVGVFTNLIVRTGRGIYVFDLVSSKTNHQDYLKVTGAYGSPVKQTGEKNLIKRVILDGRK